MALVPIKLSSHDQKLIKLLATHYDKSDEFRVALLPKDGLSDAELLQTVDRFRRYGLIEWHSNVSIRILPKLLEAADMLENPPQKDYWANIVAWFRGRWWSVPFVVIVVCVPLLYQWVEMLKSLLRWIGAID